MGQFESGQFNAHHPVIHTIFVGSTITLGQALFGSFNGGVFLSVAIQAALISALFSYALYRLAFCGMKRLGAGLCTAYLSLNPIIQLFAFCTTKDVIFSALVVVYVVLIACNTKDAMEGRKKKASAWAALGVVLFFVLCLRSNAIVAFIISLPFQVLLLRKASKRGTGLTAGSSEILKEFGKRFILISAAALVACGIFLGPISRIAGVESSPIGLWNMLCVPEQQLASVAFSPDADEQDRQGILELAPGLEYQANLSDIARGAFSSNLTKADFLKAWLQYGLKYPGQYITAFVSHIEAVWNPLEPIQVYTINQNGSDVFAFNSEPPCTQVVLNESLTNAYQFISGNAEAINVPVLGLLIGIPFYVVAFIMAFAASVKRRSYIGLLSLVPVLALVVSNLFGPTMLLRYFLYLIFGLPFFLWLGFSSLLPANKANAPAAI